MADRDFLARRFEESREHLRGVAYRMLGSLSEADDAVQEAWLRLDRSDSEAIDDLRRWLTVVVSRICLDMLRVRRAQLDDYVGTWLPEPVVHGVEAATAEDDAVLADSVGLALLVVLEILNPLERLAFVLHDVFNVSFDEIARVIDRTPAAARQLASRARRRVQGAAPSPDTDRAAQKRIVEAFLAAARAGDFDALVAMLAPDVVMRTDGGGRGPLARPPLVGIEAVAGQFRRNGPRYAKLGRPVVVNGAVGVLVGPAHDPIAVVGFTIANGLITAIDLIGDPDKLRHIFVD